ncbi:MAG TPA: YvcK family protein [Bryobacteraceae bacterium]|nr:YvcK family protein [Bryobacteraceae bacterium]
MYNSDPLRVVAIGGGTGLSALLQGLKHYTAPSRGPLVDITALVTVTDDGGSSGRLRREFDVLPPGDIRNCMVALSEDEALLSRLFQHRFQAGLGLKGHSFGNLFLTALTQLMGDFPEAVKASSEVLKIKGRIYPATAADVSLEATLADGTRVRGETNISKSRKPIRSIRLRPRKVKPMADTLTAIARADLITLGPGSLFTSVVPNLLVEGIAAAIRRSRALKAYFVNLMWQPGETVAFTASDHIRAIHKHAGGQLIDCAIVNTAPIEMAVRKRYERLQSLPVENDLDRIAKMGVRVVTGKLVQSSQLQSFKKVRHDPEQAAALVVRLAQEARRQRSKGRGRK